jgi:hypothetical protein
VSQSPKKYRSPSIGRVFDDMHHSVVLDSLTEGAKASKEAFYLSYSRSDLANLASETAVIRSDLLTRIEG